MIEPKIGAIDIIAHELAPPISRLHASELTDSKTAVRDSASRLLIIGIMISVLVHLAIVLVMVKLARSRTIPVTESPRVSVQIHIRAPRPAPAFVSEPITSTPIESAAASAADSAAVDQSAEATPQNDAAVALERGINDTTSTPEERALPSIVDIRRAVRTSGDTVQGASQPECTPWMRRHEMFTQCEPADDSIDYDRSSRAAVLAPILPVEPLAEPAAPANATDTGERLRSLLDGMDDRFGTSRTRRSIMQLP